MVRCWVSEGSAVAGLLWCVASLVCCSRVMRGWRVGVGWCVENCIVDASIFVVKFLGHMVDALVPGTDEGRWNLR